ncbi:hypothetical protein ACWDRR_00830 [Kitasatospora sp. NPDC003701]
MPNHPLAHTTCEPSANRAEGADVPVQQTADDLPAPPEEEDQGATLAALLMAGITVAPDPEITPAGIAQCLGVECPHEDDDRCDCPDEDECLWETGDGEALPPELLAHDMAAHGRETGHTRFVQYLATHVTVSTEDAAETASTTTPEEEP